MLNSSHVQRKLEGSPRLQYVMRNARTPRAIATGVYLTLLSRFPTEEEFRIAAGYSQSGAAKGREAVVDLSWALVNSKEFLFRH
jgi:hypothetical protein